MRRGRIAVGALCASVISAGAGVALVARSDATGSAVSGTGIRADSVFRAGLDHELALNYGAAFRAYRAALLIDPSYLPPLAQTMAMLGAVAPEFFLQFVDSLALRQRDPDIRLCTEDLAAWLRGRHPPSLTVGSPSMDARACGEFVRLAGHLYPYRPTDQILRLLPPHSEVPAIGRTVLGLLLNDERNWSQAMDLAAALQRGAQHPLSRVDAYAIEAMARHRRGDERGARAAEARAHADPAWSLGGFRARYHTAVIGHDNVLGLSDRTTPDSIVQHEREVLEESIAGWRLASHQGDQLARLAEGSQLADWLLDRGRLSDAVTEWTSLSATADSMGDPSIRARAHMKLGRALVKTGRLADAERHLLTSRTLQAKGGTATTHKETEHNLLHLYEALGKDVEARRAGEGFVRFASLGGLHPVRMMSARDFARFLRSRGEIEESRRYFTRMLADVDSLGDSWHWAGEYYELSGELDKARRYYMRAIAHPAADLVRVQEALVRISLLSGDSAAAIRFARVHDQRRTASGVPESAPLLPGVLRQLGRFAEASKQLESARRLLDASDQVAASAAITLELAELASSQGEYERSRALADSAAAAARSVGSAEVAVRANAVSAVAALNNKEDPLQAVRALDSATREADRLGHTQLRVEVRRRRAEGIALTGRWRAALEHYADAAVLSDSVGDKIALDPEQASFRAAQRAVYDGALSIILAHSQEPDAAARFADWSRRRKARGYAPSAARAGARGLPTVPNEQALIDYVVLDSSVAALVVTRSRATLIRLPVAVDTLRQLVRQVHTAMAARVGSTIDLSRATFPLALAHQLYLRLVAPLERYVQGARAVTIIPDGPLFLVPFDALVTELSPGDSSDAFMKARYLVDRHVVTEAVSAPREVSEWQLPAGPLLAIAPAVEGPLGDESSREVMAIQRIVPTSKRVTLRGTDATERAVRDVAPRNAILHFAAHAVVNHHDPASSRLVLSADASDDGALHSDEIAQLRLPASLVVLSACETAAGRVLEGEGVLSLSRSFLRAGASATVATLWPVGPRSADFMAAFYSALMRGTPPGAALREAKITLRRAGVPPFVWAPYVLIARGAA